MTTANYNIRLDDNLKTQAFAVIERFGLSPAQAIRLFLTQIAETNKIPLSFDYEREEKTLTPSKTTLESIEQMQRGEFKTFDNLADFVKTYEKN